MKIKKLKEAFYESDFSDIPEITSINYEQPARSRGSTFNVYYISDINGFVKALEEIGYDKFKIRSSRMPVTEHSIEDAWMDLRKKGWSVSKAFDSSLKGFNEVYICQKINNKKNEKLNRRKSRLSESGYYWNDRFNMLEPSLNPPSGREPVELESEEEIIYYDFDTEIVIGKNGYDVDFLDDTFGDNLDEEDGCWYSEEYHEVRIADGEDVGDKIFDLIENDLPEEDGKYRISGEAELHYDLYGVNMYPAKYEDGNDDIDTEYAETEYLDKKSSVKNLKITKIS